MCSTHPGTGVPIVLAGSKLTSDQVTASFGKKPLPRKVQNQVVYKAEDASAATATNKMMPLLVYTFFITFFFFAFFPANETHQTAASFINSVLPKTFRVSYENDLLLERLNAV